MLAASMLRSWKWVRRGLLGLVVVPIAQFLGIRYMVRHSVCVRCTAASGSRLVCVWCLR